MLGLRGENRINGRRTVHSLCNGDKNHSQCQTEENKVVELFRSVLEINKTERGYDDKVLDSKAGTKK